jgi:hypothetical protein
MKDDVKKKATRPRSKSSAMRGSSASGTNKSSRKPLGSSASEEEDDKQSETVDISDMITSHHNKVPREEQVSIVSNSTPER